MSIAGSKGSSRVAGVGVGAMYIPAFIDTINHCINILRYPDEVPTYALLAGILTASLCFGSAVGASGGENFGVAPDE